MLTNLTVQLLNIHAITGMLALLKTAIALAATGWVVAQFKPSFLSVLSPCRIRVENSQPGYRPTSHR
jgi:hypothetical protein